MIKKFIISIVTLLLALFPDSGYLLMTHQQLSFTGEMQTVERIIDAFVGGDVETIIDMYSNVAISTGEVTTENIENLLNSFEGKLLYGDYQRCDSSDYSNNGKSKSSRNLKFDLVTTETKYRIYAYWTVVDTENIDEVGLTQLIVYPYIWEEPRVPISVIPLTESLTNQSKTQGTVL